MSEFAFVDIVRIGQWVIAASPNGMSAVALAWLTHHIDEYLEDRDYD